MITTDQMSLQWRALSAAASVQRFEAGTDPLNLACTTLPLSTALQRNTDDRGCGRVDAFREASLGWRDVKHILAATATKVDPDIARVERTIDPTGYVYEEAWTTNAAGYHFHNWYGFGRADAEAAVKNGPHHPLR